MSFAINYLAGGRLDPPFMPTKIKPYILGRLIEFDVGVIMSKEDVITLDFDVELLSVAVGVSRYYARDYWELLVNGEKIFETVYTKDIPEGAYLIVALPIAPQQEIRFKFFNEEGYPKFVWFNYQFLK